MENMNLSDKSKEALKSGTWQKLGEALRAEVVKEYLKTGYADKGKEHDIEVSGTTYKVLDRGEITTFYDGIGNTLFDVENAELAAKYDELTKTDDEPDLVNEKETAQNDKADKDVISSDEDKELPAPVAAEVADSKKEDIRPAKLVAKEKLEKELKDAKEKTFAEPIIGYLIKRCEEDEGVAEDVAQKHKTWKKCFDYIYEQARRQANNARSAFVRDDTVYEWAEDYYHRDDKAEEEKKAKEAAERKKKEEERKKKAAEKKNAENKNPKQDAKVKENTAEQQKPKKNPKEIDGQMDMFALMGM